MAVRAEAAPEEGRAQPVAPVGTRGHPAALGPAAARALEHPVEDMDLAQEAAAGAPDLAVRPAAARGPERPVEDMDLDQGVAAGVADLAAGPVVAQGLERPAEDLPADQGVAVGVADLAAHQAAVALAGRQEDQAAATGWTP